MDAIPLKSIRDDYGNVSPVNGEEMAELAEELLVFLEASDAAKFFRHGGYGMTDIHQFDGALTMGDIGLAWAGEIAVMAEDEIRNPSRWVTWPLDATWCQRDEGRGWPKGSWAFNRLRTCDPKEARGKAAMIAPRMVIRDTCYITPDGVRHGIRRFLAFVGGRWVSGFRGGQTWRWVGSWEREDHHPEIRSPYDPDERHDPLVINLAHSVMLIRRYYWSVCLSFGGPSIRFLTDPTGVREIFKLRDLPEGKLRRAALRNWVRRHNRRSRADAAALIDVRRHLRGATKFTWNGMTCVIEPSGLDLELNRNHH